MSSTQVPTRRATAGHTSPAVTAGGRKGPRIGRMLRWLWLVPLWMASPAHATVVLPADFPEMVARSTTIVHGRVSDVRAQMTGSRRSIESVVTIEVIESLKGTPGSTVVFRTPNGQLGRYRRITVGAPEFVEGDEVVLFLAGRGPALPFPFGLSQGVYRVARRPGGLVVTQPLIAGGGPAGRVVRGDPAHRPLPLPEFTRQVRALAGQR